MAKNSAFISRLVLMLTRDNTKRTTLFSRPILKSLGSSHQFSNYAPIKIDYKAFEPAGESNDKLAPIIFLHGLTNSKEIWNVIPQIISDETKRKAYAYDMRNHGKSEYTEQFSFDLLTQDLFQFMDELNTERAILVGHCMGSMTSTLAALKKPERIEMLFSQDMFLKEPPKGILDYAVSFTLDFTKSVHCVPKDTSESDALSKAVDIFCDSTLMVKNGVSLSSRESLKKSNRVLKRRPDGGYDITFNKDAILRALENPETFLSDHIGQFNGPSYFLYGENSYFSVGSEKEHIRTHFPKAEFIEFEGKSHNLHLDVPDKFVEEILYRLSYSTKCRYFM